MKTFLRIIALLLIICVVAFVLRYVYHSKNSTSVPPIVATSTPTKVTPHETAINPLAPVPVSLETIKENSKNAASVSVEYPKFPTLPADFNAAVKASVTTRLADFRKFSAENDAARRATAKPGETIDASDYSFIAKWEQAQVNPKYVSFIIRFDSYTGGANENQELETFNYNVETGKIIDLSNLFPGVTNLLSKISTESRKQLIASLNSSSDGNAPVDSINEGTEPMPENFKSFTFTDNVVTIYFPKYSVAPGAFGEQKVTIPLGSIK